MFESAVSSYIANALRNDETFAVFRLPGGETTHIHGRDDYELSVNNFNRPFTERRPIETYDDNYAPTIPPSTDIKEYLAAVASIRDCIKHHQVEKVVYSRVIGGKTSTSGILEIAQKYFLLNPNAFRLFCMTRAGHVWLMATPELLLGKTDSSFTTMALAGTRPKSDVDTDWDVKNRKEQNIVDGYISQTLDELRITYTRKGPFTFGSNNLEHLCTLFSGDIDSSVSTGLLVDTLSPTPAICGFPVPKAVEVIDSLEGFRRTFYGGYTAVRLPDGKTEIYVNLRCACIDMNTGRFDIFVGGGITADSLPDDEYAETGWKAETLFRLLTN